MTLLMMLLTTATAWADTGFNYIGADGAQRNTFTNDGIPDASVTVITSSNMPTEIGTANTTTWCVVTEAVEYENSIEITGDVHFIIADGANMIIGDENYGINISDNTSCLYIYGQATGSGILTINYAEIGIRAKNVSIISGNVSINQNTRGISANNIDIYGGSVTITDSDCSIFAQSDINIYGGSVSTNGSYGIFSKTGDIIINIGEVNIQYTTEKGICSEKGDITINGGQVTAVGEGSYGIYADEEVTITGGTVTASGTDYGINANNTITINSGTVTATGTSGGINAKNDISITGGEIYATGDYGICSYYGSVTINGGNVNAYYDESGIFAEKDLIISDGNITVSGMENADFPDYGLFSRGNIIISGGEVNASAGAIGIYALDDITINGGRVVSIGGTGIDCDNVSLNGGNVTATGEYGIYADNNITLNGATIKATTTSNYLPYAYNGTVKVAEGLNYTAGNNTYYSAAPLTEEQQKTIAGKTIKPCITGKEYESNYWTTFYTGSVGFTIDEAVNAYAYTAEVGTDNITLHLLGKVIPKQTAVIIVSESETITMSADAATNISTVPENNLHGVDVATATSVITSELGQGTIFVLGKTTDNDEVHFGFHRYTGATMPARKAFLLINSSNDALARGISVVFDDDSTTGIKAVNRGERIVNSDDAWFDLQGRKIQEPTQRGLYIHNGKKIVVK